jgi:hypothetical protein
LNLAARQRANYGRSPRDAREKPTAHKKNITIRRHSTVPDHEEIQAFITDKSRLADEVHMGLIRDNPALVAHVQDLANRLTAIIAVVQRALVHIHADETIRQ